MKKLITTVVLTLLTLFTIAQDFTMSIYKVEVYSYNTINENWDIYKTSTPQNMKLRKYGSVVAVDNQNQSNYRIGQALNSDNKDCANWMATDKDNMDCGLQFCIISDENHLGKMTILYVEKMLVIYYFQPENEPNPNDKKLK